MMHDRSARGDMEEFISEKWFKDRDKSSLKYDSEIRDFNLARDSPSSHRWTLGCPSDSSSAGMLDI
jgi:hypothetical protein